MCKLVVRLNEGRKEEGDAAQERVFGLGTERKKKNWIIGRISGVYGKLSKLSSTVVPPDVSL